MSMKNIRCCCVVTKIKTNKLKKDVNKAQLATKPMINRILKTIIVAYTLFKILHTVFIECRIFDVVIFHA